MERLFNLMPIWNNYIDIYPNGEKQWVEPRCLGTVPLICGVNQRGPNFEVKVRIGQTCTLLGTQELSY